MKTLIALALLASAPAFAANPNLTCIAEDGSAVQGNYDDSEGTLSDVRIKIRDGEFQAVPGAQAALLQFKDVHTDLSIASLVVKDANGNILVTVASDVYVDRTGTYSIQKCEMSL